MKALKWVEIQEENFLAPCFARIQTKHKQNLQSIEEFNVLMLGVALGRIHFSALECIGLQLLLVDQSALNKLELDVEYAKQFLTIQNVYENPDSWH